MGNYINFEETVMELGNLKRVYVDAFDASDIYWVLNRMPKVEIVRCKDCRFNTCDHKCLYPDSIIKVPDDNDFCSYGRPKL